MAQFDPSKGFDQNGEYELQQQALQQRQKMSQALAAKSSPIVAVNSKQRWIQGLSKVATGALNEYSKDRDQKRMQEMEGQRRVALADELQSFMTKNQGGQTDVLNTQQAGDLMNQDIAPQPRQIAADPKAAMVQAMTSQHPELRAIGGQQMMAQMTPQKPTDHIMPNGDLIRVGPDGVPKNLGNYQKQQERWEAAEVPGADGKSMAAQRSSLTGKIDVLDKAPRVTTNVNNSPEGVRDKAFNQEVGKEIIPIMKATREESVAQEKLVQEGLMMHKLANSPDLVSGAGADAALFLNQWADKLGIPAGDPRARTETAQKAVQGAAQRTLDAGQKMKGSFSDADIKFLSDIAAGRITLNAGVLKDMAGLAMQTGHNSLMNTHQQRDSVKGNFGTLGQEADKLYPAAPFSYKLPMDAFKTEGGDGTPERLKFKGALSGAYAKDQGMGGALPPANIPPQAVDMLKRDPSTRQQFEQIFGPGSAAKILGQ